MMFWFHCGEKNGGEGSRLIFRFRLWFAGSEIPMGRLYKFDLAMGFEAS